MSHEIIKKNEIDAYYSETPDYAVVKTHFHNVHQMILVVQGAAQIGIDEKTYYVTQDSLVFISNLEKHAIHVVESPYKRYVISLKQDFCHMMLKDSPLLSILIQRPANFNHVIKLNPDTVQKLQSVAEDMLQEIQQKNPFWKERLSSLISEILIRLYRVSSMSFPINDATNAVKIVTDVQSYIVQNSHDEITLEMMASQHFVSKYYLSRIFREITGYTFRDYLLLHRLSVAKDLLTHTNKSVTDVCYFSGFNNINHFIRIFKKHENITPYQFRKQHKSN